MTDKNQKQNYTFVNTSKIKRVTILTSLGFIIASLLILSGFYGLYTVSAYFDSNQLNFRSPVIIQTPVTVEKRVTVHVNFAPFQIAKAQELNTAIKWTNFGLSPIGLSEKEKMVCEIFTKRCADALRITKAESGMRCDALNYNSNKTYDLGMWQLNTVHEKKGWKRSDMLDCYKSTLLAKQLFDEQGFSPWVAAQKLGIK